MHGCRTCLSRYDLSPLFSEHGVVRFSSDQLLSVTGVKIEPNDGLPQSACRTCIKQISKTLELREMSSKIDRRLRSIMLKYNTVIKTEQNHNTLQTLIDPFSNENIMFCKDIEQKFMKGSRQSDVDHNNDSNASLIEHTEIKTSSQSYENDDRNKRSINDVVISDRYDSDVHDSNDDSDISDTIPMVETINESIDDEVSYSRDNILTDDNDSFKQSNDINDCTSNVFEPDIFLTTQSKTTKDTPKVLSNVTDIKENKYLTRNIKMLTQEESALSKSELTGGKLCDVQIENFISKKELDELFEDNDSGSALNKWYAQIKDIIPEKELKELFGDNFTWKNIRSNSCNVTNINKAIDSGSKKNILSTKDGSTINEKSNCIKININTIDNGSKKIILSLAKKDSNINDNSDCIKGSTDTKRREENYNKYLSQMVKPRPPKGPFQCEQCDKKLSSLQRLRYHAKRHFEPEFPCEHCPKKFYNRNFLSYHQQRMHGKEKRLSCPHCDYKAVDRLTLKIHKLEHTGERPYICNECGATFRSRTVIIQHMIKHFGVKKFQCEICSAMFSHRSRLAGHRMKHLMIFTYHCYLCPRTYTSSCSVKKHLLKEHGVPYKEHQKIKFVKTKRVDKDGASAKSSAPTTKLKLTS